MTAPERMPEIIWAQAEHDDDPKYGIFWIASKVAQSEPYHHQRVVDDLVQALEEAQDEIDRYIWHEYPSDHPVHERYRARDFAANPARAQQPEAEALCLSVEKPSAEFYDMLKALHKDYAGQMELAEPFDPVVVIGAEQKKDYRLVRGLIESVDSGSFGFVTQGEMRRSQVQTPMGVQEQIEDRRIFEGWRQL